MLTLNEFKDVDQTISIVNQYIDDDVYDKAEFFEIDENPENLLHKVTLFNADGATIIDFEVEDFDVVKSYLEEIFDLEEDDFDDYPDVDDPVGDPVVDEL